MKVDNNVCLHCGACVGICPPNALFLHETETIEFLDNCTECGLCVWVCPVGAIDFGESPVKLPPKKVPAIGSRRFLVGVDGGNANGKHAGKTGNGGSNGVPIPLEEPAERPVEVRKR